MPESRDKRASKSGGKHGSDLMHFADLGIRLACSVGLFTYAGYRLDAWLSTGPWLLLTLCFVGVTGGMVSVVSGVNRWQAATKASTKADTKAGEGQASEAPTAPQSPRAAESSPSDDCDDFHDRP